MSQENRQFSTFYLADRLYGIDVMRVQEVVKAMPITKIPLSSEHVHGLINLRGQIATAIGLKDLFKLKYKPTEDQMNVVCESEGILLSLLVDKIGDVVEVDQSLYERPPETIPDEIRTFMYGVYKLSGELLSIIDIDKMMKFLNSQISKGAT